MACNTVLVVEDDTAIREVLVSLLELEGYTVKEAKDGKSALDILPTIQTPCLILLDLMMPIMDGWQFLAMKNKDVMIAPIPVLVVSALSDKKSPAGVIGFIRKPVDTDLLLRTVKEYCSNSSVEIGC